MRKISKRLIIDFNREQYHKIKDRIIFQILQNNYIKTSKYTLLTFLPLNLFEQFQRLANFYFLCLMLLQMISVISSLTPITTSIPLIGVLSLTAIKDAYDDYVSTASEFFSHYQRRQQATGVIESCSVTPFPRKKTFV